ncbi:MAG: putative toxin-antitoxin system toxin component, PIN family [Holophagales bacterium]|nr:putative toxin-antitoxin system toxin component, PIN family [Holophagales bacterium]MYG29284.1 putative toxin-antitoxin system toxin component, PIN family [Holophagales bacterium]MYI81146.1 putative toxin-antitoxin system toxin component, PIN family [Holophagales bacterium]
MTPVRAVLDTNVLLSVLVFPAGRVSWLRSAWRAGRVRPLVSKDTTAELIRVLAYPKFRLDEAERQDLLDDYLPFCEAVVIPSPPPAIPACRDPFDRPLLLLATAGRADALVTGDADLLALVNESAVPIVTPAEFRDRLRTSNDLTEKDPTVRDPPPS